MTDLLVTDDIVPLHNGRRHPVFQVTFPETCPGPQQLARLIHKIERQTGVYGVWATDDRHLFIRHTPEASAFQVVSKAMIGIAPFKCLLSGTNELSIVLTGTIASK